MLRCLIGMELLVQERSVTQEWDTLSGNDKHIRFYKGKYVAVSWRGLRKDGQEILLNISVWFAVNPHLV